MILLGCSSVTMVFAFPQPTDTLRPNSTATASAAFTATRTTTPEATPTFTPSATPTLPEAPTPPGVYQMKIPANVVWYNTKIPVRTGQYMEISAWGKSNISGQPNHDDWDLDGDLGNCPSDCLLPGAGYGTLIGILTGSLPFRVGSRLTMRIPADGMLLAINDNEPCYFDNSGYYTAAIRILKDFSD